MTAVSCPSAQRESGCGSRARTVGRREETMRGDDARRRREKKTRGNKIPDSQLRTSKADRSRSPVDAMYFTPVFPPPSLDVNNIEALDQSCVLAMFRFAALLLTQGSAFVEQEKPVSKFPPRNVKKSTNSPESPSPAE